MEDLVAADVDDAAEGAVTLVQGQHLKGDSTVPLYAVLENLSQKNPSNVLK